MWCCPFVVCIFWHPTQSADAFHLAEKLLCIWFCLEILTQIMCSYARTHISMWKPFEIVNGNYMNGCIMLGVFLALRYRCHFELLPCHSLLILISFRCAEFRGVVSRFFTIFVNFKYYEFYFSYFIHFWKLINVINFLH